MALYAGAPLALHVAEGGGERACFSAMISRRTASQIVVPPAPGNARSLSAPTALSAARSLRASCSSISNWRGRIFAAMRHEERFLTRRTQRFAEDAEIIGAASRATFFSA